MKNQVLTSHCKPLLLLGIFAITLSACSSSDDDTDLSNSAPSVSAGEDQTVNQGATVNLTGVASDSDGSISSWLWQQTSGSPSVTIKNSTTSNASFTAPEVEVETTLVFELEVKDNDGASVSDSMRVTVRGPGDSVNPLPSDFKAEAGDTQVTLTWSHYSSATDYNIYRSSASDCELANYTSCANGALFTSKSSPFTDTGLTNDTTYYYWIEAILEGVTYLDNEATSAIPAADEDDIDLTNGLVAHYEFDGDASDSSGNGNDGVEYGGVSYSDGVEGSAFDSNPELEPYYELDGDFDTNTIKTVAVWIYQYGRHDRDHRQILFSKYSWDDNRNFLFTTFDNTNDHNRFCAYFYNSDQDNEGLCSYYNDDELSELSDTITVHQNSEMNEGQWYHLAYTDDGSNLSIYINGTKVSEKIKQYSTYLNSSPPVYIGYARYIGSDFSYDDFLNAKIDDLRVYNRALNSIEVQTLYELGDGHVDLTDGLVARYEFENNADDSSGNDNDGQEFGGVSYTDGITGSAFDSNPELKPYYKLDGEFDTNNIKTVAVWIYQYGRHDMDQRQILFSKYDWSNNRNFFFSTFDNTDDHSRFCAYFYNTDQEHEKLCSYYDDDELSELSETITMHQNNEMNDGQWYHLSYTDDGSKLSIYINGTRVSEKIKEYSTYLNSSPPVYIGYARNIGDDFSYEDFLNAKIDDFRVYNRALNAAEIQTLYELGDD